MKLRDWLWWVGVALLFAAFVVLLFAVATGCALPQPRPDPGERAPCAAVCANLQRLGCDAGRGSPGIDEVFGTADDVACTEVCEQVSETVPIANECAAEAQSCAAANACIAAEDTR